MAISNLNDHLSKVSSFLHSHDSYLNLGHQMLSPICLCFQSCLSVLFVHFAADDLIMLLLLKALGWLTIVLGKKFRFLHMTYRLFRMWPLSPHHHLLPLSPSELSISGKPSLIFRAFSDSWDSRTVWYTIFAQLIPIPSSCGYHISWKDSQPPESG